MGLLRRSLASSHFQASEVTRPTRELKWPRYPHLAAGEPLALQNLVTTWDNERSGQLVLPSDGLGHPFLTVKHLCLHKFIYYMDFTVHFFPLCKGGGTPKNVHELIVAPAAFDHLTRNPLDTNEHPTRYDGTW